MLCIVSVSLQISVCLSWVYCAQACCATVKVILALFSVCWREVFVLCGLCCVWLFLWIFVEYKNLHFIIAGLCNLYELGSVMLWHRNCPPGILFLCQYGFVLKHAFWELCVSSLLSLVHRCLVHCSLLRGIYLVPRVSGVFFLPPNPSSLLRTLFSDA